MPAAAATCRPEPSWTEALLLTLSKSTSGCDELASRFRPLAERTAGGDRSSLSRPPMKLPLGSSTMVRRTTTLSEESRRPLPLLLLSYTEIPALSPGLLDLPWLWLWRLDVRSAVRLLARSCCDLVSRPSDLRCRFSISRLSSRLLLSSTSWKCRRRCSRTLRRSAFCKGSAMLSSEEAVYVERLLCRMGFFLWAREYVTELVILCECFTEAIMSPSLCIRADLNHGSSLRSSFFSWSPDLVALPLALTIAAHSLYWWQLQDTPSVACGLGHTCA